MGLELNFNSSETSETEKSGPLAPGHDSNLIKERDG